MKKTLLVTIDYPPRLGGVARYWDLATEILPKEKWVVLADSEQRRLFFRFFWPKWLKGVVTVYREYKRHGCEQIVAAQLLPVGSMAYVLHKMFKIPYVVQLYGMDLAMAKASPRKRQLAERVLLAASHCLVNSQATGKLLETFGVKKYTVVYPIPRVVVSVAAKEVGDRRVLLSVGRLVPRKGHDLVIQALPRLLKTYPRLRYEIVGDGPHRDQLEILVREKNLQDCVTFHGSLSDQERNAWLAACEMLVMPARETGDDVEGFGMVFLEAYAFSKPVIGGKSGGVSEAVRDGETGLLVDPASVDEMAAAIDQLLSDRAFAQKLGQQGKALLQTDFSLERMRDTLISTL